MKPISSRPGSYRRYRFPSLYGEETAEESPSQELQEQQYQHSLEQGYQQGFEQGKQAGYEAGQEAGRQQGIEQGRQQGQAQLRELQRTLADELRHWQAGAEQQWQQLSLSALGQQRQQICELVEQVARRVIRSELTLNPEQVLAIVEEALQGIDARVQELQLYVNPEDQQRLQAIGITECQGWALHADPALAPGDCRIETETLTLEALTEERLQKGIARVSQSLGTPNEPA
ncbi:flagellar assembly protein FliH [Oceanisphaera sediminis]|uniref:Flagellar assembly protein FliH n=1 Tax=Oceanisphaera sediminis TaxID=981381 RepID=A0ABP7DCW4_9GAMM